MSAHPQTHPLDGVSPDSQFPGCQTTTGAPFPATTDGSNSDMWLYRERTVALLRRYLRISIEVGRLPSIHGRELFRSKVTSYRMSSFEDGVIFVHNVEQARSIATISADYRSGTIPGIYPRTSCRGIALRTQNHHP
jgi:hypothetical protein